MLIKFNCSSGNGLLNANAGYTQTKIHRHDHAAYGHQANANLGIPGVASIGINAGHNHELSLTDQGYNIGSQAHVGVGSHRDEVTVNANAHYGHSTLASGVPVGVKLGASVGADATVDITDGVQVKT